MKNEHIDGYINRIQIGGKTYALKCEIIEAKPIVCKKCGGPVELKFGHGKCEYCGTFYSTNFTIIEE